MSVRPATAREGVPRSLGLHLKEFEDLDVVPSSPTSSDFENFYGRDASGKTSSGDKPIAADVVVGDASLITSSPPASSSPLKEPMTNAPAAKMAAAAASSPIRYPPSSSPNLVQSKKRKLFQSLPAGAPLKKSKYIGGFLDDEEEDEDEDETPLSALADKAAAIPRPADGPGLQSQTPTQEETGSQTAAAPIPSSPKLPPVPRLRMRKLPSKTVDIQTASGTSLKIPLRVRTEAKSYESIIAERSVTAPGRAKRAYYGIDIHTLMDDAKSQQKLDELEKQRLEELRRSKPEVEVKSIETATPDRKSTMHQMWTEKYRAKKFTELVGDERTHRGVLRWLKAWDKIVFPGSAKPNARRNFDSKNLEQRQHRKILLLTGPPGLGKTTLAHVCARQAGYEVLEINASDDRSRDVVKGRIRDALGTETVRGIKEQGKARKAGRPVCVVVDEVDGVVTGSSAGGGEGGFIKALIDLVQLDQRSSEAGSEGAKHNGKKRERFRMLRPLILVCNDVYAPSLRPLRTSSIAEIVHVRKPPIDKVITRLGEVFAREQIPCDNDAVRRLCESSWGLAGRKQNGGGRGVGEGDIRNVLVQAEWMAHKLRAGGAGPSRLTRKWLEPQLGNSQTDQKGLGRGGVKEVVDRIFVEGAGLPNLPTALSAEDARLVAESKTTAVGISDLRKRAAISALREMIDTCGEHDRTMTECFASYPTQVFQDDVLLTKPNAGYDWLHFHDSLSSRVYSGQEWELIPYLSTGACGFHNLFAAVDKGNKNWHDDHKGEEEQAEAHPFSGLKADFAAHEAQKANQTVLAELQNTFAGPLLRLFPCIDAIATELVPNVAKMLAPDVRPVVIGGSGGSASVASVRKESEKTCVKTAVRAMMAIDVSFEKVRVEIEGGGAHSNAGFAYRMEPPLDTLLAFHMNHMNHTNAPKSHAPIRYAVRQVLSQELQKEKLLQNSLARNARAGLPFHAAAADEDKENEPPNLMDKAKATANEAKVKRDFFGRIINEARPVSAGKDARPKSSGGGGGGGGGDKVKNEGRVWVSFHEGFSNAVRKPITLQELLETF